jgi:hypothetical protein
MPSRRNLTLAGSILALTGTVVGAGCYHTPIDVSGEGQGPAPLRMPSPAREEACGSYEDSLTGGQVFTMYCGYCHNAPQLAERNFANFRNVAAHMRVRANLTGKEYAKLMEFLRRWNDVPNPPVTDETGPKRFIYSQPISELREDKAKTGADLPTGPRPGAMDEGSPGQPAPGNSPREGR